MQVFTSITDPAVAAMLSAGGMGILRTDTLYGVVARADDERAVARVYTLKERAEHKSPIVLIDAPSQLYDEPKADVLSFLRSVWPGPVSVIIQSKKAPTWIRRDNDSVAYRLPKHDELRALVRRVGPLIAPSANPEGKAPALSVQEAIDYFGNDVDFYVDGGTVTRTDPSQLIVVGENGNTTRLR